MTGMPAAFSALAGPWLTGAADARAVGRADGRAVGRVVDRADGLTAGEGAGAGVHRGVRAFHHPRAPRGVPEDRLVREPTE